MMVHTAQPGFDSAARTRNGGAKLKFLLAVVTTKL
jgi:hypothetical protein